MGQPTINAITRRGNARFFSHDRAIDQFPYPSVARLGLKHRNLAPRRLEPHSGFIYLLRNFGQARLANRLLKMTVCIDQKSIDLVGGWFAPLRFKPLGEPFGLQMKGSREQRSRLLFRLGSRGWCAKGLLDGPLELVDALTLVSRCANNRYP